MHDKSGFALRSFIAAFCASYLLLGADVWASRRILVHPYLGGYQYLRLFNISSVNQTVNVEAKAVGGATLSSAAGVAAWGSAATCASQFLCTFGSPSPRVIAPFSADGLSVSLQDWSGSPASLAMTTMAWVITVGEDQGALAGQTCSQIVGASFLCEPINGGRPF